ncbi:unnamed protein product [Schistosoma mattheei]|uniref:Uncharacterized protein n=1 Tax=Schistosoma mattheei TaxID=31246 RepID=A0A3P8DW87_9TREM|nr:unnamed protein product [Schistosoma mattheei]
MKFCFNSLTNCFGFCSTGFLVNGLAGDFPEAFYSNVLLTDEHFLTMEKHHLHWLVLYEWS